MACSVLQEAAARAADGGPLADHLLVALHLKQHLQRVNTELSLIIIIIIIIMVVSYILLKFNAYF